MVSLFQNLTRRRNRALLPEGVRVYAIGDIHGCAFEYDQLMERIVEDRSGWAGPCHLVFVGDYVDRGPDSKRVIDALLKPPRDFEVCCLRGNHDQTLLDFLDDAGIFRVWREFGGNQTLMSYGVTPPRFNDMEAYETARREFAAALPARHLAFFRGLPLSCRIGGYFFVHAGVRPGIELEKQTAEDQLWIREEFLWSQASFGAVVVHGHTPSEIPIRRANRIGVDTGAYATGLLTAAVLEGDSCRFMSSGPD